MTTAYRGAGQLALAGRDTLILMEAEPDAALVGALWAVVADSGSWDDVVSTLLRAGVSGLPPLGLVHRDGSMTTVLLRGPVTAAITIEGAPSETVSGERVTTWTERSFDQVAAVELSALSGAASVSGPDLPLLGGVVRAATIRRAFTGEPSSHAWPAADRPAAAKTPVIEPPVVEPPGAAPLPARVASTPSPEPSPAPSPPPASSPAPSPAPSASPAGASRAKLGRIGPSWGAASPGGDAPAPTFQTVDPARAAGVHADPVSGGVGQLGDHDNHTRPSVRPPRPAARRERSIMQFNAVKCGAGHVNPAHGIRCRVCDAPIDDEQARFEIPQPVVGRLRRLPDGESFPLRGRVLVGREPRLEERGTMLSDAASLVDVSFFTVVSPEKIISRTHMEVRVVGWTVEVIDFSSTHTEVANPGQPPVRLRRGNPAVILPGARIVMADEVTLCYEVTE